MTQPSENRHDSPRICLITPPDARLDALAHPLERILDTLPVACLRLAPATRDEAQIARLADGLREIAHRRDIPLVIEEHMQLALRLGLDGVHLHTGAQQVRKARKLLGKDAIVGAHCAASRHSGMNAGEAGADYISFGPVQATALGDGTTAPQDLFSWWSEMIEIPVIAEGGLDEESVAKLSHITDFFAFQEEVWAAEDPLEKLRSLHRAMQG